MCESAVPIIRRLAIGLAGEQRIYIDLSGFRITRDTMSNGLAMVALISG